jgi:glycosyltransferase involved in cell wall biosynthesis
MASSYDLRDLGKVTRFSVVIAAYNQRDRLLEAVESVQRQTLTPHEVIVVDDGSSDGSADAVRLRYPDVKLIVQANSGKGIARNRGAYLATGDWVCFLDHDDLWHPEKLAAVQESIEAAPDAVAVDHEVWIFREDEEGPGSAWGLQVDFVARTLDETIAMAESQGKPANDFNYLRRFGRSYEASLKRVFSTTSAISIQRETFFEAGGFNPGHANGEDWALSINVARIGEWQTVARPLSFQRFLASSGTYDRAGLVMILATLANHWYSGRPLETPTTGFDFLTELRKYGPEYRALAQGGFWSKLRRADLTGAAAVFWFSMLLLPRWRDRLYVLTPPRVAARLYRHGRG